MVKFLLKCQPLFIKNSFVSLPDELKVLIEKLQTFNGPDKPTSKL